MRVRQLRRRAGWLIFAALIIGMNLAAFDWAVKAKSFMATLPGNGRPDRLISYHEMYDGSFRMVVRNPSARTTTVTKIRPATTAGLCRVWWPVVAAGLGALLALAIARTGAGRWFIAESPVPRMTTRRWMIVVAVLGIEGGLVIGTLRDSGVNPLRASWTLILMSLAILHALAFTPAGLVALYRHARRGPRRDHLGGLAAARER